MVHELHQGFHDCISADPRKTRSSNSIRTYCYNLCWLAKRIDGFTADTLPDAEAVLEYMKENNIPTKRRQMSYSAMKVLHNIKGNHEESKKYAMPLMECKRQIQSDYDKQERTDRQRKNWKHAKLLREETFKFDGQGTIRKGPVGIHTYIPLEVPYTT